MGSSRRARLVRLLIGDRSGVARSGAPASRVLRVWRGYPEIAFLLCLTFFFGVNYSGIPTHGWVPWTFQELTLQRVPDPVVPYTLLATAATSVALTALLTPRIGVPRAVLIGVSVPVGVVGLFELAYLFVLHPGAFWGSTLLDPAFSGYLLALTSYAVFGLVGGGWWKVPRWWWYLLIGAIAGFASWFLAGVPLPESAVGGHTTPGDLLGVALVVNVVLKWTVFVLAAAPIVVGAWRCRPGLAASDASVLGSPGEGSRLGREGPAGGRS